MKLIIVFERDGKEFHRFDSFERASRYCKILTKQYEKTFYSSDLIALIKQGVYK